MRTVVEFDREPGPDIPDPTMIVRSRQVAERATLFYQVVAIALIVLSVARVLVRKRSIYSRMH